jgi:hypothetical protein
MTAGQPEGEVAQSDQVCRYQTLRGPRCCAASSFRTAWRSWSIAAYPVRRAMSGVAAADNGGILMGSHCDGCAYGMELMAQRS